MLLENLKKGILKRRSILSSSLQVLDDSKYDFELETEIGQKEPSNPEIIDVLIGMLDDEMSVSPSVSDEFKNSQVSAFTAFSYQYTRSIIPSLIRLIST